MENSASVACALAVVGLVSACSKPAPSPGAQPAPAPVAAPAARQTPAPAPPIIAPTPSTPAGRPSRDRISGKWKLTMGAATWVVDLVPRPDLPGEDMGVATREAPNTNGEPVTMEVGTVLTKGEFHAWLTMGVIHCSGPYRMSGPIKGSCRDIQGEPAGAFTATRVARSGS